MTESTEYQSAVSELVNKARIYNSDLGFYEKHYLNENFNFSVKLSNNYGVKISRILAQDYSRMPSILTEEDLKAIANSAWKL